MVWTIIVIIILIFGIGLGVYCAAAAYKNYDYLSLHYYITAIGLYTLVFIVLIFLLFI